MSKAVFGVAVKVCPSLLRGGSFPAVTTDLFLSVFIAPFMLCRVCIVCICITTLIRLVSLYLFLFLLSSAFEWKGGFLRCFLMSVEKDLTTTWAKVRRFFDPLKFQTVQTHADPQALLLLFVPRFHDLRKLCLFLFPLLSLLLTVVVAVATFPTTKDLTFSECWENAKAVFANSWFHLISNFYTSR